jgi:hypothetical protein
MENVEDELLARFVLFNVDFQEAGKYFQYAKIEEDKFILDALIKIEIVTYAKPFLKSNGVHKKVKKYCLFKDDVVPSESFWLHEMFMDYRGNYIGHSNFKSIKPEVPIEPERKNGLVNIMSHWAISYDHWFTIDPEFSNFPLLIDEAIKLVSTVASKIPGTSVYLDE